MPAAIFGQRNKTQNIKNVPSLMLFHFTRGHITFLSGAMHMHDLE